jgi:hypothetical protein
MLHVQEFYVSVDIPHVHTDVHMVTFLHEGKRRVGESLEMSSFNI